MIRKILVVAAATAATGLALSACSSSGGGNGSGSTGTNGSSGGGSGGKTIASTLTFGGPPEWASRRQAPLQSAYGVSFAKIVPLDTGGPNTVTALKNGQVDAADLFTSDPAIKANNFVILSDDKSVFGTQNVVPLINKKKATPGVTTALNTVDAALTNDVLIDLNTKVQVDKQDPEQVATGWLKTLPGASTPAAAALNKGVKITVGSANFPESELLADIYATALQGTGATVSKKLNVGAREKYFPALKEGSIDLVPEYLGSILTYLDKSAAESTVDQVKAALATKLPSNLTVLQQAPAQDNDSVVVTQATAQKYGLKSIADLAKPAS